MPFLELRKEDRSRIRRYELPVKGEFTIGRSSSNALALHDLHVSRKHCVIDVTEAGAVIRDVGSTRGFKVNLESTKQITLKDSDCIFIGPYELTYYAGAMDKSKQARPTNPLVIVDGSPADDTHAPIPLGDSPSQDRVTRDEPGEAAQARAELERSRREHADAMARAEARIAELLADAARQTEAARRDAARHVHVQSEAVQTITRLEHDQTELVRTLADVRVELAAARARECELEQAIEDWQAKAQATDADATSRHAVLEALQSRVEESERALAESEAARQALESREIEEREALHLLAASAHEQQALLEAERDRASTESRNAGEVLVALRGALDAAVAERDVLRTDLDAAREAHVQAIGAAQPLQVLLVEHQDQLRTAEADAIQLRQELTLAHDRRAGTETELRLLRDELLRDEGERARDEAARKAQNARVADLQRSLDEATQRIEAIEAERDRDRIRADEADRSLEAARETDVAWQRRFDEMAREGHERDTALDDERRQVATLTAELDASRSEAAELRSRLERDDHAQQGHVARIEALESRLNVAENARRHAEKQVLLLQSNRDEFKQRLREVEARHARLASELSLTRSRLDAASRELAATHERSTRTQTALVEYLRRVHAEDDIETSIVELTEADIARAQLRGATLIEIDDDGPHR